MCLISKINKNKAFWPFSHVFLCPFVKTHWGRTRHICVITLTIIGSDNGLSPCRCQAIIWTNAGNLLIRNLETIFSEYLSEIHTFSWKKMHLKMSSAKFGQFFPDRIVLNWLTWHWIFEGVIYIPLNSIIMLIEETLTLVGYCFHK